MLVSLAAFTLATIPNLPVAAGVTADARNGASLNANVRPDPPCPGARNAIRYYRNAYTKHRHAMRQPGPPKLVDGGCVTARTMAAKWRRLAHQARVTLERWVVDQYAWWRWMPSNWAALGACETGYGRRPGNWHHDSGTYVSAFGIERGNYAKDAHRIGNLSWDETRAKFDRDPTPREQYDAAVSHYQTYGDGWGCPGP